MESGRLVYQRRDVLQGSPLEGERLRRKGDVGCSGGDGKVVSVKEESPNHSSFQTSKDLTRKAKAKAFWFHSELEVRRGGRGQIGVGTLVLG